MQYFPLTPIPLGPKIVNKHAGQDIRIPLILYKDKRYLWSCRDLNPGPPSSCQGFSVRSSRRISARLSGSDEHVPDDEPSRQ